jgi:nucleotide-binding universal stress UspA family protein
MAQDMSAELRAVCFSVRPMAEYSTALKPGTEHLVVDEWVKRLEDDIAASLASSKRRAGQARGPTATRVETVLGKGSSWSEALHDVIWNDGDLLVVGTSTGPLSRLYLGSHASKIVRNSPVPVLLLPRGQAKPS